MSKRTQAPSFMDFYEEIPSEEVVVPPTDGTVAEEPIVSEDAPTAPVETPAPSEEQQIPKSRFDEVYAESKQTKRQLEEVSAKLAEFEASKTPAAPQNDGPELDDDAQAAIDKLLASKGYMSKKEFEELRATEVAKVQLDQDVKDLSTWAESKGYPKFDLEATGKWAKENGVNITSKKSLEGAYLAQNQEAIITAAIKAGVSTATETPKATVERPGAATGKAPSAPDDGKPKTLQNRIGEALASLNVNSN